VLGLIFLVGGQDRWLSMRGAFKIRASAGPCLFGNELQGAHYVSTDWGQSSIDRSPSPVADLQHAAS